LNFFAKKLAITVSGSESVMCNKKVAGDMQTGQKLTPPSTPLLELLIAQ
jgi:hypothetical protein